MCQQPKPLRNSHVVPEFLYAPLYDKLHRFVRVKGFGGVERDLPQKGLREPLLCDDCEQFLNDTYEKPFKRIWVDQTPLPPRLSPDGVLVRNIDYPIFKLFHLSILFRAGVAKQQMFDDVQLGPHEAVLRQMVSRKDPGRPESYPVFALAIVDHNGAPMAGFMTKPYRTRFEGHAVYAFVFGACMWFYTVSGHKSPHMIKIALQPSGQLRLVPEFYGNLAAVKHLSRVLRAYAP